MNLNSRTENEYKLPPVLYNFTREEMHATIQKWVRFHKIYIGKYVELSWLFFGFESFPSWIMLSYITDFFSNDEGPTTYDHLYTGGKLDQISEFIFSQYQSEVHDQFLTKEDLEEFTKLRKQ